MPAPLDPVGMRAKLSVCGGIESGRVGATLVVARRTLPPAAQAIYLQHGNLHHS